MTQVNAIWEIYSSIVAQLILTLNKKANKLVTQIIFKIFIIQIRLEPLSPP